MMHCTIYQMHKKKMKKRETFRERKKKWRESKMNEYIELHGYLKIGLPTFITEIIELKIISIQKAMVWFATKEKKMSFKER